jgi:hypothetical protein
MEFTVIFDVLGLLRQIVDFAAPVRRQVRSGEQLEGNETERPAKYGQPNVPVSPLAAHASG